MKTLILFLVMLLCLFVFARPSRGAEFGVAEGYQEFAIVGIVQHLLGRYDKAVEDGQGITLDIEVLWKADEEEAALDNLYIQLSEILANVPNWRVFRVYYLEPLQIYKDEETGTYQLPIKVRLVDVGQWL